MALDEAVTVQQLGPGGMTLAAAVPLSPAHIHDLRLTFDDRVVTLKARVVHTRARIVRDDVEYVSGVSFVDPSPEAVAAIEDFLGLPDGDEQSIRRGRVELLSAPGRCASLHDGTRGVPRGAHVSMQPARLHRTSASESVTARAPSRSAVERPSSCSR